MKIKMDKIILIDDISVIIKNNNFIKDSVPRFFAKCLDEKYKLWIKIDNIDINGIIDYECIPFWLKQNMVSITDSILENLKNFKFSEDSFIISNNSSSNLDKSFLKKYKLKIYKISDIFDYNIYQPLDISDIVLCFGFDSKEFKEFCSQSNLMEYGKSTSKKYNGVAFLIKSNNLELEFQEIKNNFNDLVKKGKYQIKHKEFVIGATKNGKGLEELNLNIIGGKKLSLVLV